MIYVLKDSIADIQERDIVKYLGGVEEDALTLVCSCKEEVLSAQSLAACYKLFPVQRAGDILDMGFLSLKSRSLSLHLAGCNAVAVFAATAGVGIDRLIAKYSRISPARAAAVQAAGAALIEEWCERVNQKIHTEMKGKKTRFSCGYGDVPLTVQQDIFRALEVTKRIGITLSDSCFMTPTKSVTAFVGITGDSNGIS